MKKCKCGHSRGVHWHACRLASCGYPGCKCKRFDEAKETPKTETQIVLEQVLREDSERQKMKLENAKNKGMRFGNLLESQKQVRTNRERKQKLREKVVAGERARAKK